MSHHYDRFPPELRYCTSRHRLAECGTTLFGGNGHFFDLGKLFHNTHRGINIEEIFTRPYDAIFQVVERAVDIKCHYNYDKQIRNLEREMEEITGVFDRGYSIRYMGDKFMVRFLPSARLDEECMDLVMTQIGQFTTIGDISHNMANVEFDDAYIVQGIALNKITDTPMKALSRLIGMYTYGFPGNWDHCELYRSVFFNEEKTMVYLRDHPTLYSIQICPTITSVLVDRYEGSLSDISARYLDKILYGIWHGQLRDINEGRSKNNIPVWGPTYDVLYMITDYLDLDKAIHGMDGIININQVNSKIAKVLYESQ